MRREAWFTFRLNMSLHICYKMSDNLVSSTLTPKPSLFSRLSMLSRAISNDEEPTPGYMYKEISNISHESGSSCQELLAFFVDQLSSKSSHVRFKVLKILSFVVKNGHPDFREGLMKKSLGITDSIQFSGPPHPQYGMSLYVKVRKQAAELSEALFSIEEYTTQAPASQAQAPDHAIQQVPMGGMGSSGGGHMQGFGNTVNKQKSIGGELVTSVIDFAEKILSPPQQVQGFMETTYDKRFGAYQAVNMTTSVAEPSDNSRQTEQDTEAPAVTISRRKPTERLRGVPGGGWADTAAEETDQPDSMDAAQMAPQQLIKSFYELKAGDSKAEAEETLVHELVMEDTDHFYITHARLKDFVNLCSDVNCDNVLKVLNDKMTSQDEIVQMRCMLVIEALVRSEYTQPDQVVHHCASCLVNIHNNQHSAPASSKARKILRILEKLSNSKNLISSNTSSEASTRELSEPLMQNG